MSELFDFTQFFKKMSAKGEINVDLSGIDVKNTASATSVDETGVKTNNNLTEYVTNDINYIINNIYANSGETIGISNSIVPSAYYNNTTSTFTSIPVNNVTSEIMDNVYYRRLYDNLGNIETFDGIASSDGSRINSIVFGNYVLELLPRHELFAANSNPISDAYKMHKLYAALGLYGKDIHNVDWVNTSGNNTNATCIINENIFKSRLNSISKKCKENGIELLLTYYDTLYTDPDTGSTDYTKINDYTNSFSWFYDTNNISNWCTKLQSSGYMADLSESGDGVNPFLLSATEAFKSYFDQSDDLVDNFYDSFTTICNNILNMFDLIKYMDTDTKNSLFSIFSSYKIVGDETSSDNIWLIDIDSIISSDSSDADKAHWFRFISSVGHYVSKFYMNDPYQLHIEELYTGNNKYYNYILDYEECTGAELINKIKINLNSIYLNNDTAINERLSLFYNYVIQMNDIPVLSNKTNIITLNNTGVLEDVILNYDKKFKIIKWGVSGSDTLLSNYEPMYKYNTNNTVSVATIISLIDSIKTVVNQYDSIMTALYTYNSILAMSKQNDLKVIQNNLDELNDVIEKIKWYQEFTNESVFETREYIDSANYPKVSLCEYKSVPARLLIPVKMYRRVKTTTKILGIKRTKWKRKSIGVRWVEIRYIDTSVYKKYVSNTNTPYIIYNINSPATISVTSDNSLLVLEIPLKSEILKYSTCEVSFTGISGYTSYYDATINSDMELIINDTKFNLSMGEYSCTAMYVKVDLEKTQSDDSLSNININYNIPYLPYDTELSRWAFTTYGPFDQSKYATQNRSGDYTYDSAGNLVYPERNDGYTIFPETSKDISSLRQGLDIYNKVALLLCILKNVYGSDRVQLLETVRSIDDQESLCLGGEESTMLSWHNYGLAVKIRILKSDLINPIEDGDSDMLKLIDIAETFSNDAYNGKYGDPINVVWCGLLVIGANIFDWEFLPIGVTHKDAPKFRNSLLSQKDPIIENGYINVTDKKYAVNSEILTDSPYILKTSNAYKNGININGNIYVSQDDIINYNPPNDINLINIIEFINLIKVKMDANGSTLTNRSDIYEWKSLNPISFKQLILYYTMTNNIASAKGLISGDYIEKYQNIINTYYNSDHIEFVKQFLGNLYYSIKIYVESAGDGAYILLSDGKMRVPIKEAKSTFNMSSENLFGQKQIDVEHVEYGTWKDGVFISENDSEMSIYTTDSPVIDGYENGIATSGDALYIHTLISAQIKKEFDSIKTDFESLNIKLMYDNYEDGPNADDYNILENEFGIIQMQDLLPYNKLKNLFIQKNINNKNVASDGTVLGAGVNEEDKADNVESIFEKIVSNAEMNGIRTANLTKEHVIVTENTMSTEQFINIISNGKIPSAKDII